MTLNGVVIFFIAFVSVESLSMQRCSIDDGKDYILQSTTGSLRGSCQFIKINEPDELRARHGNVYSWLAVPYAEAPTGKNRFMKTVPKLPWKGQLSAVEKPSSCIQDSTLYSKINGFKGFSMLEDKEPFSEDCLYLNIWTPVDAFVKNPLKGNESVPILVFFGHVDMYNPSTFVAASQVIVVTVNYRLGVFGFLKLAGIFPGNQGLSDQNEALKWIKNNAKNMGGDPERITIAGHGNDASLASYHLFIKESHDLYRNMILQSGSPLMSSLRPIRSEDANERALRLVNKIGCGSDVKQCLQDSDKVAKASSDLFQDMTNNNFITQANLKTSFPPCIDGNLLVNTPEELLSSGDFKQCSILNGVTAHEGSSTIGLALLEKYSKLDASLITKATFSEFIKEYFVFSDNSLEDSQTEVFFDLIIHEYTKQTAGTEHLNLPIDLTRKINYFRQLTRVISDQRYVCPAYRLGDMLSRHKNNVYMYLYSHRVSTTPWPKEYGAVHGDDLAFTFGFPLQDSDKTEHPWSMPANGYFRNEKLLTNEIINYWSNFIKFDSPNEPLKEIKWPAYKYIKQSHASFIRNQDQSAKYMVFKSTGNRISRGYSLESCILWNSYLPKVLEDQERLIQKRIAELPACPTPEPTTIKVCPTLAELSPEPTTAKSTRSALSRQASVLSTKPLINHSVSFRSQMSNFYAIVSLVSFRFVCFLFLE